MSFLKQVIEDASAGAISSGAVAATPGMLFNKPIKRKIPKSEKINKMNIKAQNIKENKKPSFLQHVIDNMLSESTDEFNSLDVISKLQFAEKNINRTKNTTVFGLESDKKGGVVKVHVPNEQAAEFEKTLQRELRADKKREVAEILFDLRNKFNISYVEWPAVPEDEEVDMELSDQKTKDDADALGDTEMPDDKLGDKGDDKDKPDMNADLDAMAPEAPAGEDDSSVKSMLDKVIDMLKQDAEARKAEAEARGKEAQAKEAEAAAKIADQKVRAEEELFKADQYAKSQSEEKKEAQRLAKLAAYRQAISQGSISKDYTGF
jgi:hypothetical protein